MGTRAAILLVAVLVALLGATPVVHAAPGKPKKASAAVSLHDFLQGREMCSTSTRLATPLNRPSAETSDWARFLNPGAVQTQGQLQETFHPNAYAQRALGTCLTLIAARTGDFACNNTPGAGTGAMVLTPRG